MKGSEKAEKNDNMEEEEIIFFLPPDFLFKLVAESSELMLPSG